MLDSVKWTLDDFVQSLEPFGLVRETRPRKFEQQQIAVGRKNFSLHSAGWLAAEGRLCARYARIQGAAMDIATVMAYPTASPDHLPVFAAEWVVFGDRVHALILDVEVCGDQPELLARLQSSFSGIGKYWQTRFPENRDRPAWFSEIAMPWALYGSCSVSRLDELRVAFNQYLALTIDGFYANAMDLARPGQDAASVKAYKHHHYINSPGHRLLGVKLGQQETDQLLKDWHFGPARLGQASTCLNDEVGSGLPFLNGADS